MRNTLETTKHKVCEQLKSWESRMKTEVFSVFSYKLKQETKHRFYINFLFWWSWVFPLKGIQEFTEPGPFQEIVQSTHSALPLTLRNKNLNDCASCISLSMKSICNELQKSVQWVCTCDSLHACIWSPLSYILTNTLVSPLNRSVTGKGESEKPVGQESSRIQSPTCFSVHQL